MLKCGTMFGGDCLMMMLVLAQKNDDGRFQKQ
jgi:hypothetical protein